MHLNFVITKIKKGVKMKLINTIIIINCLINFQALSKERDKAGEIDKEIKKVAKEYKLNYELFYAILKVESNLNQKAFNPKTLDYGIAQVNEQTAKLYNLNLKLLKSNRLYNLNAGAKILADLKLKYEKKEPLTWYCRYNIGTGLLVKKAAKCIKYLNKIAKEKVPRENLKIIPEIVLNLEINK
jgi:soluble lytic murein transglycosylase-like protein